MAPGGPWVQGRFPACSGAGPELSEPSWVRAADCSEHPQRIGTHAAGGVGYRGRMKEPGLDDDGVSGSARFSEVCVCVWLSYTRVLHYGSGRSVARMP